MARKGIGTRLVSFIGQKGGVGKSALARVLAVAAARAGYKVLLADFDLEQLTCVEWNAARLRRGIEPEIDARPFKSMKKLKKANEDFDLIVADTRGLADDLTQDVAEESDLVFLPTGTSADDLRPTLALARKLAKHGAEGKITLVMSKIGKSGRALENAIDQIDETGFPVLSAHWLTREGFQTEFDSGRAGAEATNRYLREIADGVEKALMAKVGLG